MVMEEKAKTSHGLGHEAIRAKHGSNYSRRRSSQGETHASSSSPRQETHGSKRAVLCGILYKNSRNRLEGCVNDVFNIKKLLVNLYGFSDSSIIILTDDQSDPETRPTKRNIMKALNWLVQGVRPQDSLVFHFSGHGSKEGPNLELYPLDYKSVPKQRIVGDELNETIIKPLPQGAKLHVIIDACHSGNGLSLPYRYKPDRRQGNHWDEYPELRRNGIGGTVVCFSACDDDQIAADTRAISGVFISGALTSALVKAIFKKQPHPMSYGELLETIISTVKGRGLKQIPQLTSNKCIDEKKLSL